MHINRLPKLHKRNFINELVVKSMQSKKNGTYASFGSSQCSWPTGLFKKQRKWMNEWIAWCRRSLGSL